jgi:hypothetical protein
MVHLLSQSTVGIARSLSVAIAMTIFSATLTNTPAAANPARSFSATDIERYRSLGQAGLEKFLAVNSPNPRQLPPADLRAALDALCQQRDCHASRLFWYTDLAVAQAKAVETGKPILSLRLLGNLDQELSCANSRFFRVALYANAEVSQYLRDRYVLHWQSVRPVPHVTIDYGDGRKLQRTLTGNSIHYVLDANGQPIDALPGLYGPQAFLEHLKRAEALSQNLIGESSQGRRTALQLYHRERYVATHIAWRADLAKVGITERPFVDRPLPFSGPSRSRAPAAIDAGRLAMTKSVVEMPLLSASMAGGTNGDDDDDLERFDQVITPQVWRQIADLHQGQALLDLNSKALMLSKNSGQWRQDNAQFEATVNNFETSMALDTVRNQYLLHVQLHRWFMEETNTQTVDALNTKVYTDLFLTPNSDPWLGLRSENSYSAIDNDGLHK